MTEIPASERIEIRRINSPIGHPAFDQHGLFAAQDLEPDTIIIDYMGFVHSSRDADPSSTYDLSLDRELDLGVDSTKMGNEARFINDYRGIRERPNADFRERVVRGQRRMSVWVMPAGKSGKGRKGVRKGEEIVVSYGKGFWAREAVVNHEDEWDSHDPEHEHVGHLP
ncbi:MAG: hypothetical protein M1833_005706 [Piccolia ochrophora]|nr:MAG: hypothetical protein M1833_005706 [Piccolia ochrophora]